MDRIKTVGIAGVVLIGLVLVTFGWSTGWAAIEAGRQALRQHLEALIGEEAIAEAHLGLKKDEVARATRLAEEAEAVCQAKAEHEEASMVEISREVEKARTISGEKAKVLLEVASSRPAETGPARREASFAHGEFCRLKATASQTAELASFFRFHQNRARLSREEGQAGLRELDFALKRIKSLGEFSRKRRMAISLVGLEPPPLQDLGEVLEEARGICEKLQINYRAEILLAEKRDYRSSSVSDGEPDMAFANRILGETSPGK